MPRRRSLPRVPYRIERRPNPRHLASRRIAGIVAGLLVALLVAPLLAPSVGSQIYTFVWNGTLGSPVGVSNVLTVAAPLVIAGLAVALTYRLGLWNIGVPGQMLMGAWFALWIGFEMNDVSGFIAVPVMLGAGFAGGAAWMLIPALARVYLGVNEIVSTFLMNFGALAWASYWIRGEWFDSQAAGGFHSRAVPSNTELGSLDVAGVVIHWGVLAAVILPLLVALVLQVTRGGFEAGISGASERAARYAGMPVERRMLTALLASGGLAGFGGVIDMLGDLHVYGAAIGKDDLGFGGLVIAVLAGGSMIAVVPVGVIYALMTVAGLSMSVAGVEPQVILALVGLMSLFAALAEAFARVRFVRARRAPPSADVPLDEARLAIEEP
jgi:simple sugar transport system permease protein